jgi:hypothetical protein
MSAGERTQFELVEQFWSDLVAVDQRILARARRLEARRRLRRTLALAVLVLLGLAAIGLAAKALLEGEDAPESFPASATIESGALPGSVRLLPVRTPDPVGGPPWGIRVFYTPSQACFQVGRVVKGKLVALGVNGAFHDDGRYHPLPVEAEVCSGGRNRRPRFGAGSSQITTASGLPNQKGCVEPGRQTRSERRPCRTSELRRIFYGLAGPGVAQVTLRVPGVRQTHQLTRDKRGTYLFVLKGRTPRKGAITGRYRDGTVCALPGPFEPTRFGRQSRRCLELLLRNRR